MFDRTSKERLYWLIELYKNNQIAIDTFCNEFHITYDHNLDSDELSAEEERLFGELAYDAARFNNFEEDLKLYPSVYSTEHDINEKIKKIISILNI